MAFEGDVKDFGLSEILQLISVQQKSGMLLVKCKEKVAIFFREGEIISTRDRRDQIRDPLEEYLIRYGFLGKSEMQSLKRIQTETKLDLTDILLSEKYYSEDELKKIFTDQIYETIQEVISWPKSHYKFISGNRLLQGVKSFTSIRVDAVLMESMRRIDEFAELEKRFPSLEMTFKNLSRPEHELSELTKNEKFIYGILHEEMKLSELISRGRMPRFNIYEALKELLEKGLIQINKLSTPETEELPPEEKEEKDSGKRFLPASITVLTLIICFFIGEVAVPQLLPPGWSFRKVKTEDNNSFKAEAGNFLAGNIEEVRTRQLEKKVRSALNEYSAKKKSYPLTLEILSIRGYISEGISTRVKNAGFKYKLDETGLAYTLRKN
ncbi:MAG TPA: DUF4388 domain-containing protein [Candidatus Krumholzibacteriaceae bacterium]|nr:DUF4388 domain-containing protein [Candidatus Krumholzibacteriaceae bacterium]